jgi:bacterioferritin (cytochrome b1)
MNLNGEKKVINLLVELIEYIEYRVIEDYGYQRSLKELLNDNEMPGIYYKCITMLNDMGVDIDRLRQIL